jgi:hypothetical protein
VTAVEPALEQMTDMTAHLNRIRFEHGLHIRHGHL